jgi:glycosyltransferase involved in cell wall biosynthesis
LLVFVGRLVEEKGISDLIRAVALLVAELPDATVMILGDGQERADMEALASRLDVSDRVHFLGWVESEEVPAYLAAADIFVGPSKRAANGWVEAQGLTFVEAMLARTPVIATRSGGIPDAVRHEETGLLVSENAPEEIAAAISRLVADPTLASRLKDSGYALALRDFTRETTANMLALLLDGALSHSKGKRALDASVRDTSDSLDRNE